MISRLDHILVSLLRRKRYLKRRVRERGECRARVRRLCQTGLCYRCGARQAFRASKCRVCWLKDISRAVSRTGTGWRSLARLFVQQRGRCPYTGDSLRLDTAVLDHIYPSSRFPELRTRIDNLAWTTTSTNLAKGDMTPYELLAFCYRVITNHERRLKC